LTKAESIVEKWDLKKTILLVDEGGGGVYVFKISLE